ncbi:MAG: nicotinate-nucleotide adenylyltransferase [Gammaproteobacteria bacterium]
MAEAVLSRLNLAQLQFIPCANPVHRGTPSSAARQRCEMIDLAIAGRSRFVLNTLEIDRGGPSYTVDSLQALSETTASPLLLIIGADAFNRFMDWKSQDRILSLCNLIVCHRPDVVVERSIYSTRWVDSLEQLSASKEGAIFNFKVDDCSCSSSEIRLAVNEGLIHSPCLNDDVADYIQSNNLYRSQCD